MMEEAVGQGTAEPFVKQDKEEGHAGAFVGQAIGIAMTITFDQTMALHLAQVVAELVEAVVMVGEMEAGQNSLMNLDGRPPGDLCSAVKENFHQANHARVVNFDTRKMSGADLPRKRQALEQ